MKTTKLKFHSAVDLITNSSTTIFTYSEGSEQAAKDLLNEMLKVFGSDKTADDIFHFSILLEKLEGYCEFYDENVEDAEEGCRIPEELNFLKHSYNDPKRGEVKELFMKYVDEVIAKNIEKPQWMIKVEEEENYYDYFRRSTSLYVKCKDEKYKELGEKLINFLYSIENEASYG